MLLQNHHNRDKTNYIAIFVCMSDRKKRKSNPRPSTRRDLTGQKFGRLTGINVNEEMTREKGCVCWNFQCDCGNLKSTSSGKVTSGGTKSCGCLNTEKRIARLTKSPGVGSFNYLLYQYKKSASKRDISWDLKKSEFKEIISKPCYYCDIEPKPFTGYHNTTSVLANGVDRVNSSIGYRVDNVVSCCKMCNYMKHTYTEQEFLDKVERIYNKWHHTLKK